MYTWLNAMENVKNRWKLLLQYVSIDKVQNDELHVHVFTPRVPFLD